MLLEEENKNLMKAINMLKFNTKIKEFEKDMIKQYLDPQSTFKKIRNFETKYSNKCFKNTQVNENGRSITS